MSIGLRVSCVYETWAETGMVAMLLDKGVDPNAKDREG